MEPDPKTPSSAPERSAGPGDAPPIIPVGPPPQVASPPPLLPQPAAKPSGGHQFLSLLLSLCLGLFVADAVLSLLDSSAALFLRVHALAAVQGIVFFFALLLALVVYLLMGLTPTIPKRVFLPVTLFNPAAGLLFVPAAIYLHTRLVEVAWLISLGQTLIALAFVSWCQGGLRLRWPLFPTHRLHARGFSWLNLTVFVLVNLLLVVPAVAAYLGLCAALAVGHFSEGFLALRPSGFSVQARKYVRPDGKSIQLVPMAHVGDASFYHKLSDSFPTNAVVLMEGVTDHRKLLTNSITYHRMASSLGLAEQRQEFEPTHAATVNADIDVEEFSPRTIGFLNLVMLVHAKGVTPQNLQMLLQFSPPPHFEEELFGDLLGKRNAHLLAEIQSQLALSDVLVVPWGAAHMPGLAREIQKAGFRLSETHDYQVIRFGKRGHPRKQGE